MNWKGQALEVLVHWVLPVLCTCVTTLLALRVVPGSRLQVLWSRFGVAFYLLTRVGGVVLLYYLAGYQGSGDFEDFWLEGAGRVLEGEVPTRDFTSSYGPLFHYAQAVGLAVLPSGHGVGVLLPFLIGEALAVFCSAALARDTLGPEAEASVGLWLVLDPMLWYFLLVGGQDEALFAGTLAATVLAAHRNRWWLAMAVCALGACLTKASYGPYAFAVLVVAFAVGGVARRSVAGFGVVVAIVVVPLAVLGWDPLAFTRHAAGGGGTWWRNLSWIGWELFPSGERLAAGLVYAGCTTAASVWAMRRFRTRPVAVRLVLAIVVVHAASMLSMPFVLTEYTTQGLPFLALLLWLPGIAESSKWLRWLMPACLLTMLLLRATAFQAGVATGDSLYAIISVPMFLAMHAAVLWLVHRESGVSTTSPVDPIGSAGTVPA